MNCQIGSRIIMLGSSKGLDTDMSGKGSKPRPFSNYKEYGNNFDDINWSDNKGKNKNDRRTNSSKGQARRQQDSV